MTFDQRQVLEYLVSEIAVFGYCLEFHDVGDAVMRMGASFGRSVQSRLV